MSNIQSSVKTPRRAQASVDQLASMEVKSPILETPIDTIPPILSSDTTRVAIRETDMDPIAATVALDLNISKAPSALIMEKKKSTRRRTKANSILLA